MVVYQRDEVVLTYDIKNMYLFICKKGDSFRTIDWNGQKATGQLMFRDDY